MATRVPPRVLFVDDSRDEIDQMKLGCPNIDTHRVLTGRRGGSSFWTCAGNRKYVLHAVHDIDPRSLEGRMALTMTNDEFHAMYGRKDVNYPGAGICKKDVRDIIAWVRRERARGDHRLVVLFDIDSTITQHRGLYPHSLKNQRIMRARGVRFRDVVRFVVGGAERLRMLVSMFRRLRRARAKVYVLTANDIGAEGGRVHQRQQKDYLCKILGAIMGRRKPVPRHCVMSTVYSSRGAKRSRRVSKDKRLARERHPDLRNLCIATSGCPRNRDA